MNSILPMEISSPWRLFLHGEVHYGKVVSMARDSPRRSLFMERSSPRRESLHSEVTPRRGHLHGEVLSTARVSPQRESLHGENLFTARVSMARVLERISKVFAAEWSH
jgi:hypothetical protein